MHDKKTENNSKKGANRPLFSLPEKMSNLLGEKSIFAVSENRKKDAEFDSKRANLSAKTIKNKKIRQKANINVRNC